MDFSLSGEQRTLQDSVRRYCERHCTLAARRAAVRAGGFSRERWSAYAAQGWLDPLLPAEAGGSGTGWVELALVAEELGRKLALESLAPAVACARLIAETTRGMQESQLLRSLASGALMFAFAHDEPLTLDAAAPIATELHRTSAGLVLRGRKTTVLVGAECDRLLVSARERSSDAASATRLVLLDASVGGIERRRYQLLDGTAASEVTFSDVAIGPDDLLGDAASTESAIDSALDHAALCSCAEAVGAMSEALALTRDHLRTRRQYGAPLCTLQALQHRVADMYAETELARSILHAALSAIDGPRNARELHISAAKTQIAAAGAFVASNALQLHGAMGMTEEHSIGHYFKKLTLNQVLFGRPAAHAARLADHLLAISQ
jgi:alkylation response protein AidB-like acyl-CoA dehydrogenase